MVDPPNQNLEVGKSLKLSTLFNQDGTIKRDLPTTWVSKDPQIASVDSQGNVTALKPGNVRIEAQTLNNTASALITVTASGTGTTPAPGASSDPGNPTVQASPGSDPLLAKLRTIVVRPENETVQPTLFKFSRLGETKKFVAEGRDSENQKIENLTFSWSSSDEKISTVNSTGVVTAVATGTSNLIASAGNVTSNIVQIVVQEGTIRAHIRFME
ncbi:MAG TPA: Ig-like domain-containing protein [Candidatus Obscuribacterales bacterium]